MKTLVRVAAFVLLAIGAVMADGSDPMPLCRPTAQRSCKPAVADGGPLFLCPPNDKTCKHAFNVK